MRPLDYDGPADRPFTPFPASDLDGSVLDRFRAIAAQHADRLAIDDGHRHISYDELRQSIDQLAGALSALLPAGEAPVAIFLDHTAEFPIAMLGVLAAGRAYVPLDMGFPLARNRRILQHSGVVAVVTGSSQAAVAADIMPPNSILIGLDRLDSIAAAPVGETPTAEDLAYILYTSGTTGEPKGVFQNHRNLLHDVLQYTNSIHLTEDDRLTMLYSGSVNGAIRDVYGALLNGASLHVLSLRHLGAKGLVAAIAAHGITVYHSVPILFRQVVAALNPDQRLSGIRLAYMAGDRLDLDDVEAFRRHFPVDALLYTGIGSTENATIYRQWFIGPDTPLDRLRVPVGGAIPDRSVALLAEDGTPVSEGESGEIVVTSRYMALGYWRSPELSRQAFRTSPHDSLARVFRTGDLGRERPDGLLEFIGRKDHQVKIRGYRVEPAEIEATMKQCPGVAEAAVHVRTGPDGTPCALAGYWVAKLGAEQTDLADYLRRHLSPAMLPADLIRIAALPLLANYKADRTTLAAMDASRQRHAPADSAVEDENSTIARVAALYRKVLQIQRVRAEDGLASLNVDSLQALRIMLEIEQAFTVTMPQTLFATGGVVAEVAAWLDGAPR
jgi:amino acid adenylation domain-containing protein